MTREGAAPTSRPAPARGMTQRTVTKGDARRSALLEALDEALKDGDSVEAINVADLSRRAGVTRSAFYFYFESKSAAVAALMETVYEEAASAGEVLTDTDREPAERIAVVVDQIFASTERHEHLYRAVLEARATNPAVREMWDADRTSFSQDVADMIRAERAAGKAPEGPDADVLAQVLLDLNDHNMERRVLPDPPDRAEHVAAVTAIWVRSVYGA